METENQALDGQVASLEAESDAQPVAIDANGDEVGTYADGLLTAGVHFDFEGLPRFGLRVRSDSLAGAVSELVFRSDDCSGVGFIGQPAHPTLLPLLLW